MSERSAFSESAEILQDLLACLRAQYWNYQQSHWQSQGASFYGNHLLFERLYTSIPDQVDGLAEKMVGAFGSTIVNTPDLGDFFEDWLLRWDNLEDPHLRGILSESDLQQMCKMVYNHLKTSDDLSLGMDDFLMSLSNKHETNQYLLEQSVRRSKAHQP